MKYEKFFNFTRNFDRTKKNHVLNTICMPACDDEFV